MRYRFVPILFMLTALLILMNRAPWRDRSLISWDASGYYMFLPASFIYHDLQNLDTTDAIRFRYADDARDYGISRPDSSSTRRFCKYPLGVALFEAPFFCITHYAIAPYTHYPADGFSVPYQVGVACASVFWAALGLLLLGSLLRRYYSDGVVAVVLLTVAFGTNLYAYTNFNPGWSHPYSFFLVAALLHQTAGWRRGRWRCLPVIGLLLGLLCIARPINAMMALIPILWPHQKGQTSGKRGVTQRLAVWATAAMLFAIPVILQMSYWKYTTGHWIFYSYGNEGFDFVHPHLWQGLFSYRKGWLVYTPVAAIMLAGLPQLWRTHRRWLLLCSVLIATYTYVVFSWRIWHYGGGFSSRPMIDILPVLALPLAALVASAKRKWSKVICGGVLALLIALNVFQTYQFSIGVIHYNNMSRAYYWRSFGRLKVTDEDRRLLLPPEEAPYEEKVE